MSNRSEFVETVKGMAVEFSKKADGINKRLERLESKTAHSKNVSTGVSPADVETVLAGMPENERRKRYKSAIARSIFGGMRR